MSAANPSADGFANLRFRTAINPWLIVLNEYPLSNTKYRIAKQFECAFRQRVLSEVEVLADAYDHLPKQVVH